MKISDYIKELNHLIETDGDIEVEHLVMDDEKCHVKMNGQWLHYNEYKEGDVE